MPRVPRVRGVPVVRGAAVAALAVLLAGCVDQYETLRQSQKRLEKSLSEIRTLQAEQTSEISSLQNQVRGLSGRVEEIEYLQRARLGTDISALKQNISNLQRRVPPPAIVPMPVLEADEDAAQRNPSPEVGKPFGEALQKIREGSFEEALPLLQQAYEKSYGGDGAAETVFWRGIAYEGLGDNGKALETYGHLVTAMPENKRKALALLRQGGVLLRMGDKRTAGVTYRKLISDYPKSPEAQQAQAKLKEL